MKITPNRLLEKNFCNIGTAITVVVFSIAFFTGSFSFALVNLVDYEEPSIASMLFSSLLFFSISFWIYFSYKAKSKTALVILAVFSFVSSVIYWGFGLFQPFVYTLLNTALIPFGASFYEDFEAFSSVSNAGIWVTASILMALSDKGAHIFLGIIALKAMPEKACEDEDKDKDINEDNDSKNINPLLFKIPIVLGVLATAISVFVGITWIFASSKSAAMPVKYEPIIQEQKSDIEYIVNLYEEINEENIEEYIVWEKSVSFSKSVEFFWKNSNGISLNEESDFNYGPSKHMGNFLYEPLTDLDIDNVKIGCSREEFLKSAPLSCCSTANCIYRADEPDIETICYEYYDGKVCYKYGAVLIDSKLAYLEYSYQKENLLSKLLLRIPDTIEEKSIGDKAYSKYINDDN